MQNTSTLHDCHVYGSDATYYVIMFPNLSVNNNAQDPNMIHVAEQLEESTPTNVHGRQICLIRRLYY
jgi:hypothetical protein